MKDNYPIPAALLSRNSQVLVLEAESGLSRQKVLQDWHQQIRDSGATAMFLNCDFNTGGIWAGLSQFLHHQILYLRDYAPHLLAKHDYELLSVLPDLRRTMTAKNPCLTDIASTQEKVRNYPADRAYRIIHGLVDLTAAWHKLENNPLVIICDHFDRTGFFVNRFFVELMRRCGEEVNVILLVAVNCGNTKQLASQFDHKYLHNIQLDLPFEPLPLPSIEEATQLSQDLAELVREDHIELQLRLHELIYYCSLSNQPEKAVKYQISACSLFSHFGFYEDALRYGESAFNQLEVLNLQDTEYLWMLYVRLYLCYATLNQPYKAMEVIEKTLEQIKNHELLSQSYYFMSMLYARILPKQDRDLDKAEECLVLSNDEIMQADLPKHKKLFAISFNQNGVALIRHRQGHYQEAIELCEACINQLNAHFKPDEHRLHRSVLLFNLAQVYAVTGSSEKAIVYLSEAMEMDPNYSEYYNDRGNLYLNLEQFAEALKDYQKAIELSPPYWEVWSNLGRCYVKTNQPYEAVKAYDRALDLKPDEFSVWVARAGVLETLGKPDAAISDYSAALTLKHEDPFLWANRASLHYDLGNFEACLQDLEQAIALAPDNADLYENRAIALISLGCVSEAIKDLRTYLNLNPSAADRTDVEERIMALQEEL